MNWIRDRITQLEEQLRKPECNNPTMVEMKLDVYREVMARSQVEDTASEFIELFETFPDVNDGRCGKGQIFDHISDWYWKEAYPLLARAKTGRMKSPTRLDTSDRIKLSKRIDEWMAQNGRLRSVNQLENLLSGVDMVIRKKPEL